MKRKDRFKDKVKLALVHAYCWTSGTGHRKAKEKERLKNRMSNLRGYDVAAFGDNHNNFLYPKRLSWQPDVINCGGFYRATVAEMDRKPWIGMVKSDGRVIPKFVPSDGDKFADPETSPLAVNRKIDGAAGALANLGKDRGLDYGAALDRELDNRKAPKAVRKFALAAKEGK